MDWLTLSHLARTEIEALQNRAIKKFFHHELPYSSFFRELFEKHKLKFTDINNLEDLQKIPFTSKTDLAPTAEDPGKSRRFILQPDEKLIKKFAPKTKLLKILGQKIAGLDYKKNLEWEYKPVHLHFTTGRSALPTAVGYTSRDLVTIKKTARRLFQTMGIPSDAVVVNSFPYAPHLAFWLTYFATSSLQLTTLQSGGGKILGTPKIIDAIEKLKAKVVTSIPGYFYHILREAVAQKRNWSGLEFVVFGGERVSEGLRGKVKELLKEVGAFNTKILATYAMTEGKTAWVQCSEETGYHTYPDMEIFEVVDENGNRVPENTPGELVYTSLNWRGTVMVRYRTGDMIQGLSWKTCPHCGRTVPQISKDIQRKCDFKEFRLTKVKGELVNLNAFYPVLSGIKDVDEWQLEISKVNNDPYEVDEMVLYIASKPKVDFEALSRDINRKVLSETGITPKIVQKNLNEVLQMIGMESELKEKRIVDKRPKG
ncbi:MAG: phenylacetate--CoA ligase [Candidatus Kerfeldbacteria bacterium CG08_land_8_20_14_0_20_43_14]|uniref:Phenylacetate--CoA ligase n=1 Tax=Candidatus Kerfeldbacteria bacterium CG08_land_8_20_14_0_20_43_14 TaxID=2014246 RepID=A0A2H0YPL5_9BACT|nr:MAG: phenylacetate--CoA ligase [Candidatus Kerfeldbacteria bacterium CG08_land_8_20_14_0_20_43_14]